MKGGAALVMLPIGLAIFALSLQMSVRQAGVQPVSLPGMGQDSSILGEQEQFMQVPQGTLGRGGGRLAHLLAGDGDYTAHNGQVPKKWRLGADFEPALEASASTDLPKVAFMTTTADKFRQIQLWTQYHRALGVSLFYLFVDGQAAQPDVMEQLRKLPGVRVVPRTPELAYKQEHSRAWNETWLAAFFHKPCNHELFVRQSLNMEEGIQLARADGADWVLHIDTDELMYPGGAPHYSLQAVLAAVPHRVDNVVFPNYESMPERDDIVDPFTEVTLFKRNFHHVVSDAYFKAYKSVTRGNPNYFITYGNGKSAARVRPGLRPNGAHRWFNYNRRPTEITHETAAVLHFTYNRFSDLKSRRDRCDCAPTDTDAKRCFILPFDRMAFLAASLKTDEELMQWFRDRLVWNDPQQVRELVRSGLFYRIYTPQVLMRGFITMNEAAGSRQLPQNEGSRAVGQADGDAVTGIAAAVEAAAGRAVGSPPNDSKSSAVTAGQSLTDGPGKGFGEDGGTGGRGNSISAEKGVDENGRAASGGKGGGGDGDGGGAAEGNAQLELAHTLQTGSFDELPPPEATEQLESSGPADDSLGGGGGTDGLVAGGVQGMSQNGKGAGRASGGVSAAD